MNHIYRVVLDSLISILFFELTGDNRYLHVLTHSFPTRRSSDLLPQRLDRRGHQRIDRGRVAKVARQRDMVAAERIAKGTQLLGVGARHREPRALRRDRKSTRLNSSH